VRTAGEYAAGHIENAGLLDFYAVDFKERLLMIPKNQPIFLYCRSGNRSGNAAQFLISNGYTKVYNLQRGIMDWNMNNLPLKTTSNTKVSSENNIEINELASIIKSSKLLLIDYYAPWCAPCRRMMPMIDSLSKDYSAKLKIVKVNADASRETIVQMKISSVPFLALYKNGEKIFEHQGAISRKQLELKIKEHLR